MDCAYNSLLAFNEIVWHSHTCNRSKRKITSLLFGNANGNLYVCMYFLFHENVISVEKQEAVNSLQEELANVQDHLNLAKQVRLTNVIF